MKFIFVIFALLLQPVYAEETGAVLLENLPSDIEIFVKNELKSQKGNIHTIITLPVGFYQLELRRNGQAFQTVDVEIIKDKLIPTDIISPCERILNHLDVTQKITETDKEFIERRQKQLDDYNKEIQKHTINYQAGTVEIKEEDFDLRTNYLSLQIKWNDCLSKNSSFKILQSQPSTIMISREQLKEMLKEGSHKQVFIYFKLDDQPALKKKTIVDKVVLMGLNQEWLIKPISGQLTVAVAEEFQQLFEVWRNKFSEIDGVNAKINLHLSSLENSISKLTDNTINFALILHHKLPKYNKDKDNENAFFKQFSEFYNKFGYYPTLLIAGKGAIVIYVNKKNPVYNLTSKEVDGIFSNTQKCGNNHIYRWDTLIGSLFLKSPLEKETIKLTGIYKTEYTQLPYEPLLLCNGQFKPSLQIGENSDEVLSLISENPIYLGYGHWVKNDILDKKEIKRLSINGVYPSKENILNDLKADSWVTTTKKILQHNPNYLSIIDNEQKESITKQSIRNVVPFGNIMVNIYDVFADERYPYSYYISFLANKPKDKKLAPLEEEFLKFILSKEGQTILEETGFIALPLSKNN